MGTIIPDTMRIESSDWYRIMDDTTLAEHLEPHAPLYCMDVGHLFAGIIVKVFEDYQLRWDEHEAAGHIGIDNPLIDYIRKSGGFITRFTTQPSNWRPHTNRGKPLTP